MKAQLSATAALLFAASAICQNPIPMPPHSYTYNGYSRGYSFTANNAFVITQLELPLDAQQPLDTASFYIQINGTQVYHEVGNAGPISQPINQPVLPGDLVLIVGNWSPSPAGQFTAHNSYGSGGGTYSVLIEGSSTVLYRGGVQWDIGDTVGLATATTFDSLTGNIGRVMMYTAPATGYATKDNYGTGCGAVGYDSIYEEFDGTTSLHDLTTSLLFINTGASYVVTQGTATLRGSANATSLGLGDDNDANYPFANGILSMPLPDGTTTNQITVASNGIISMQPGNQTGWTPSAAEILSEPQTAFYHWTDLRPASASGAGDILVEETATHCYIIYDAVQTWGGTATNTFELHFDKATGNCEMVFGAIDNTTNWGVGFSVGGPSADPGPTNLSDPLSFPVNVTGSGFDYTLHLEGDVRPVIGTTVNLTVSGLSPTAQLAAVIYGLVKFDPGLDLTSLGMPGCFQYVSMDSVALLFPMGAATASNAFAIPNDPTLAGLHVKCQGGAYDPAGGHNPLGATSSNGVDLGVDVN